MRLIKRYSNRRLYDTRASRTITHRELAALVRRGEALRVVDTVTGSDITAEVLGRIAFRETAAWTTARESQALFTRIIELGGERTMSILKNTVLASIGAFEVSKARAEKIVDELIKRGEVEKGDKTKAVMEILDRAEKSTAKVYGKVAAEVRKVQQEVAKYSDQAKKYKLVKTEDLRALEEKVERLTRLIEDMEARSGKS
ncbi:MAG TPA: polyhydroxyalkanoate synthesis regulator DNA-binding domain-containing protein [candidate division Zixibacteria bacterium]|nr:phasin family protein [candidate division Zixibacteria bacterium]MDD4918018.1 polyhydroxyalkanoate synthesis regulator DNA-binding domain-containing protein [candidate division Zixibacteria bacterium]MDM7974115.1 polyhydroxyalkanoate synthesis regulator DNA-binding domain-containing protein [candidate division Zixibacteria bacterium]HOD66878.1 polyhydroxyalkanoate synthesis regulator DNA-binding domain-containing protein [candidate division Zixibacteria bacterium]HPC12050.1 polyhydroxyalkano